MTGIVFLDTETTGLAPDCDVWELGAILRAGAGQPDIEHCWQIRPSMYRAEPSGLLVGGYYQRSRLVSKPVGTVLATTHPDAGRVETRHETTEELAAELALMLDGAILVGAVPWFDSHQLRRLLGDNGQTATHHYHLVDVETLAAGKIGMRPPWDFDGLLAQFGLKYDADERHTALGDARMVRDLYDAVWRPIA
jgi:DNA polymerase III epsilon subunit-like protein